MPRNNQTGPMGYGPMTGRGMGFCNAAELAYGRQVPDVDGFGRGMGRQRGFRRGFGSGNRGFSGRGWARRRPLDNSGAAYRDAAGEIEMLKMQAGSLQSALDSINRRMEKLEKAND